MFYVDYIFCSGKLDAKVAANCIGVRCPLLLIQLATDLILAVPLENPSVILVVKLASVI